MHAAWNAPVTDAFDDRTLARRSPPENDPGAGGRIDVGPALVLGAFGAGHFVHTLAALGGLHSPYLLVVDEPVAVSGDGVVGDVERLGGVAYVECQAVMIISSPPEIPVEGAIADALPSDVTVASYGVSPLDRFGSVPCSKGLSSRFAARDGRKLMVTRSPVAIGSPVRGCRRLADGLTFVSNRPNPRMVTGSPTARFRIMRSTNAPSTPSTTVDDTSRCREMMSTISVRFM